MDKIMNHVIKLYTANGFTDVNLWFRGGLTVQNKYKDTIKDAYTCNLSDEDIQKLNDKMSVPDRGDLYILAFASTMKKDYERVLIASNDKHLIKWEGNKKVLEEVEKIYGLETGSPDYVLEQLSAMEMPAKNEGGLLGALDSNGSMKMHITNSAEELFKRLQQSELFTSEKLL